ncbi:MAG: hypothetical protein WCF18_14340, partial [Chthoniobacteraceae bacterium]
MRSLRSSPSLGALALLFTLCSIASAAELRDTAPVDSKQAIEFLEKMRAQQETTVKQRRTTALETVKAAAASGEKAAALWKEAVKHVQYEGGDDASGKMRAWREGDGEALSAKEGQAAARFHVLWLYYTLQFHAGAKKKDLLPFVIDYTNQLAADGQAMESLDAQIEREKERAVNQKQVRKSDDNNVKRVHDAILSTSVSSSVLAKYLGLDTVLPRGADKNDRTAKKVAALIGAGKAVALEDDTWPMTPGDLEGIHQTLILPEYRAAKDPRILDYWDRVIQ